MGNTSSMLTQYDIEEVQEHCNRTFSLQEIASLYQRFCQLDRNGGGFISAEEFLSVPEFAVNPLSQRLFRMVDGLNFKEFVAFLSAFSSRATLQQKVEFIFKVYDLDGNGKVAFNDMLDVLRDLTGQFISEQQREQVLTHVLEEAGYKKDSFLVLADFMKLYTPMSSHHLKGVKKSAITDKIRSAICEYKKENPGVSQKDLQAWVHQKYDLDISQSTISNTLKRASEYLSDERKQSDVKKHKSAKYPELEKVLFEWFLQRQDKVNMSGEIIQEKGKELMKKMYGESNSDFSFSSGWLERFKARYGIKSYRRFGESGSVMMENIENALPGIRSKLDQFQLKDIYNMDETGLFYRLEADHSLATKQLEGRKKDKERITVVVCCNGDGSDKVPLWIIGKYANPRCFKNVNINNLNCVYRFNKKAWMTGLLFQEFVTWFDSKMNGRKVLLIVDNCPAHPKIVEGLRNTELFFLPPNTTSKIQPCDAGIIRAFKVHYRRRLYSSMLQSLEVNATNPEKVNILNAISFANMAWNIDVKTTTIANCFRHCKIRSEENDEQELGEINEGVEGLNEVISNLRYRNVMDVEHLLNYPNENDAVMESPTDEEIIESVMSTDEGTDPEPDDSNVIPSVSSKEAFQAITTLNNYLLQHEQNIPGVIFALHKVKDEINFGFGGKKKQATIDSYFNKN